MLRPLPVNFIYPFVPLCGGTSSPYCEPGEKCGCEAWEFERNVKITRIATPPMMTSEVTYIEGRPRKSSKLQAVAIILVLVACVVLAGVADHQWMAATGQLQ